MLLVEWHHKNKIAVHTTLAIDEMRIFLALNEM